MADGQVGKRRKTISKEMLPPSQLNTSTEGFSQLILSLLSATLELDTFWFASFRCNSFTRTIHTPCESVCLPCRVVSLSIRGPPFLKKYRRDQSDREVWTTDADGCTWVHTGDVKFKIHHFVGRVMGIKIQEKPGCQGDEKMKFDDYLTLNKLK